mgnify:CR=1 FL=1
MTFTSDMAGMGMDPAMDNTGNVKVPIEIPVNHVQSTPAAHEVDVEYFQGTVPLRVCCDVVMSWAVWRVPWTVIRLCPEARAERRLTRDSGPTGTDGTRRTAADVARSTLTLQHMAPGGFVLGVGAGEAENLVPSVPEYDASKNFRKLRITWGWVPWEEPIGVVDRYLTPFPSTAPREKPQEAPIAPGLQPAPAVEPAPATR